MDELFVVANSVLQLAVPDLGIIPEEEVISIDKVINSCMVVGHVSTLEAFIA